MKLDKPIREWKTKYIEKELNRVDAEFWAWQADGAKPAHDIESYAEDLAEELRNRGYDY